VPEQLLQCKDVRDIAKHVQRKRPSESVRGWLARYSCLLSPPVQHQSQCIIANSVPISRYEQCGLSIGAMSEICPESLARLLPDEYGSRFSTLAVSDRDAPRVHIYVLEIDITQLLSS